MTDAQPEITEEKKEFEFNWGPPSPTDPIASKELSGQKVKLIASDGKEIDAPVEAARMSVTVRNMMDDFGDSADTAIPLPNISGAVLEKIIEYCSWHFVHWTNPPDVREGEHERKTTEDIIPWDKTFAASLDRAALYELIMAANFLDVKPLLDLGCKTVAIGVRACKTAEEIRLYLGVKNDYTPEEEDEITRDNLWIETGKIIN